MEAPVDDLESRTKDATDSLVEIMPAAITLAMMFRQRKMAAWLRTEFDGYPESVALPAYRCDIPGHIVARSPQYGWIPAPVNEKQNLEHGHLDINEGVKALEKICLSCKKGSGKQIAFQPEQMQQLQAQINLSAELALTISRESYSKLLTAIRSTIYLWSRELIELGFSGAHNSFSNEEREKAAHLDDPERFWQQALLESESLPIPQVRAPGFFERVFGN
ncbi:hypothetical protein [Marinobacter caseinilyticus]|uniref:AbiTii domain-containing protein n=1 Tax=Marinobacter caseinilyticus TaxID=2692195 RepID=UPI00140A230E|nr:hypothetical protein [Marinobacter caseinilyticus]